MKKTTIRNKFKLLRAGLLTTLLLLLASAGFALPVTITLSDHNNNPITADNGTASYYDGNWHTIGTTSGGVVTTDLSAGTYTFAMAYHGLFQQLGSVTVSDPGTNVVAFQTTLVQYMLMNHLGAGHGLSGGAAAYYDGNWNNLTGTTDATGTNLSVELLPGDYTFGMSYNGLFQQIPATVAGGGGVQPVNFTTTLVTYSLMSHLGAGHGLSGGTAAFYDGNWNNLTGTTDATGTNLSVELLPGSYTFGMSYNGLFQQIAGTVSSGGTTQTASFQTTQVTYSLMNHEGTGHGLPGGTAAFYDGNWNNIAGTTDGSGTNLTAELLQGDYTFGMSYNGLFQQIPATVSGTTQTISFQTTLVTYSLKDHLGNGLSGGAAAFYDGNWNNLTGTTDATGTNLGVELLPGSYTFGMSYHGLFQQIAGTVSGGGTTQTVPFITTTVSVNLNAGCSGTLINTSTATASFYDGNWYSAGTIAGGTTAVELLPGNYTFAMSYNGGSEQIGGVSVTGATQPVNFNATTVTYNNPVPGGSISYYQGNWNTFTPSTMNLLPGDYTFQVNGGTQFTQTVTGCTQSYNIAPSGTLNISILAGGGCAGSYTLTGPVGASSYTWSVPAGGHIAAGAANAQTIYVTTAGIYSLTATYDLSSTGGAITPYTSTANVGSSGVPRTATIRLIDSKGNGIKGGAVKYYTTAWANLIVPGTSTPDSTDANGYACMTFPAGTSPTSFEVIYHGGVKSWSGQTIASNPVLVAQTTCVSENLKDHNGALITSATDTGIVSYSGTGWTTLGSTSGTGNQKVELLPGAYSFEINYHTYTQLILATVNPVPSQDVNFQTNLVSVNIKNCAGTILTAAAAPAIPAATVDYDGGVLWTMGVATTAGTAQIELLTGTYSFAMHYNYGRQQLSSVHVGTLTPASTTIDFNTGNVAFSNPSNSAITFDMTDWHPFVQPSMDLLPGTYSFRIGTTNIAAVTVNTCSAITKYIAPSGTLGITSVSNGGCGGSYTLTAPAGSKSYLWTPGGANTQSIVVTASGPYSVATAYDFTATGATSGAATYSTSVTVAANTVTVRLIDSKGAPIPGASVQFYNGSSVWQSFDGTGVTDANGYACQHFSVPTTTYFHVLYCGGSEQWDGVSSASNPVLVAQTTNVSLSLEHADGSLITDAGVGTGGFYNQVTNTFTTVPATGGIASKELLPGAYYFNMSYNNYTEQQGQLSVGAGPNQNIEFRTTLVTLSLEHYDGSVIADNTDLGGFYNAQTRIWTTGALTGGSVSRELLPGDGYFFNMNYNNYTEQQGGMTVNAGTGAIWTQAVPFQTTLVTLNLEHSDGSIMADNTDLGGFYNAQTGTWTTGALTDGSVSKELLPGDGYFFNMNYNNYTEQQGGMTVSAGTPGNSWAQAVDFQTTLVTLSLEHNDGTLITDVAAPGGFYNAQTFTWSYANTTDGTVSKELLPGSGYFFNMNYNNYTQQQGGMNVNAGDPGTTWTQPVTFRTTLVTLNLEDHTTALIADNTDLGGFYNAQTNVWATNTLTGGSVSKELLPGDGYFFNMTYNNGTEQVGGMTVNGAPWTQSVNFQTALVTILYEGSTDAGIDGATIDYNVNSQWYPFGITADDLTFGDGTVSMEMLPVPNYYNATLGGSTLQVGPFTDAAGTHAIHVISTEDAGRHAAPGATAAPTVAAEFGVFPNPATDKITIKFSSTTSKTASVKIADMSGKVIISEVISSPQGINTYDVELGNLASGIYLLTFDNGDNNEVRKINVQH